MDIFKLIKERRAIRKYKNKPIPERLIDKIVQAGIWGPSVPAFLKIQPWKFIVVSNKKVKNKISNIILRESKKSGAGVNILLHSAADMIESAPTVILVYNSDEMEKIKNKYKLIYSKFSTIIKAAELSAISAAVQNMILVAESLGIGSCWLDTPLLCENEINDLVKTKLKLFAVLPFGYSSEKGKRSPRKPITEALNYI